VPTFRLTIGAAVLAGVFPTDLYAIRIRTADESFDQVYDNVGVSEPQLSSFFDGVLGYNIPLPVDPDEMMYFFEIHSTFCTDPEYSLTLNDGTEIETFFLTEGSFGSVPTQSIEYGTNWNGRFFDGDYDGAVGANNLLDFLSVYGGPSSGVQDPVYSVVLGEAPPPDGLVSANDLLGLLSVYGTLDPSFIAKFPEVGTELENYVSEITNLASPAQFFNSDGSPVEGGPFDPQASPLKSALQKAQSTGEPVSLDVLSSYFQIPASITPFSQESGSSVGDGGTYTMQVDDESTVEFLTDVNGLPSNAQLYAFKNPEVYGDDLRGQTSEMLLNLGAEDFELFAVNLNYELVNADHTR
jgi:hypothetical protein